MMENYSHTPAHWMAFWENLQRASLGVNDVWDRSLDSVFAFLFIKCFDYRRTMAKPAYVLHFPESEGILLLLEIKSSVLFVCVCVVCVCVCVCDM